MLNDDVLRELAARASTIQERLGGDYEPCELTGEIERVRAKDRLAAWCQSVTAGNDALFAGWLAHQGLDGAHAAEILGHVRLKSGKALPQWAAASAWAMPAVGSTTDVPLPEHGENDNDKHVPFEELLWPVVRESWSKLKVAVGNSLLHGWSHPACVDLQRGLLRRLSIALAWPLYTDFNLFRHFWRYARGDLNWVLLSPDSGTIYESFLAEWRSGRWREFFLEKPVAARLLGTIVSSWLDTTAELLQRLHRDADRLGNVFGGGLKLGRVTSILTDRSDPHCRGRTVAILHFSNGLTLVYKPKDLGVDAAWEGLMQWMEWRGAPVALQTPAVLPCDGYGWTTHVVADPCAPASNSALFYRRAGSLLAVLHLLRGDDFHSDNVITSMDSPVPIDFETLLHPVMNARLADHHSDPAIAAAIELIGSSVSGTHYLPQVRRWPNGRIQAFGGIEAGFRPQPDSVSFRHINTDAMERVRHEPTPEDETAAVKTTNSLSQLTDHTESIVDGFSEMYMFFLQHQSELVSPSGPLRRFRDVRVRVVLEETSIYEFLAEQAAAVRNLTDGADWSLHFDLLARRKISSAISPQRAAVRAAELCALANLDIPHFSARTDADSIDICRGDHIEHCLAGSPFNQLLAHIARFGAADLARQVRLIRLMLARQPTHPAAPAKAHSVRLATARLSPLAEAGRLGELLASAAIRAGESAAWIGPAPVDHEHRNVRVAGPDLYSGAAGIALFLAALAHITGEARFRELAFGALHPARGFREAAEGSALAARLLGIGGATGISSLIYGLVRVGTLLNQPGLIQEAQCLARLIDDNLIASDRSYDVIGGAAGAILGLLTLYRTNSDPSVLERAVHCGDHLLRARTRDDQANVGWRTLPDAKGLLTGFSHGAAGIALALFRLYGATGETRFRDGASGAVSYERRVFMPGTGNWPDFRRKVDGDPQTPPCQWCHGAAGIGLARLGCLATSREDNDMLAEIEVALATTFHAPSSLADHLCCGNFGRIEFLLTAGLMMHRAELVATARQRASELIERATISGGYPCFGGDESLNPGFFQGISGIGYGLLRLAAPEVLPSVLLWD